MSASDRIAPPPWHSGYLLHRALSAQLRRQIDQRLAGREVDVIDVGCGSRPYEHLFSPYARRYVGVDVVAHPGADVVGRGEDLPIDDESFDCLLCSQVLEHSDDPSRVISEAWRVLRPGGLALMSTHGVIRYHATQDGSVDDYWRWTHAGLRRLMVTSGEWSSVDVYPNGGTWSALAFLGGRELEVVFGALGHSALARPLVLSLNVAGLRVDRAIRRRAGDTPPALAPNYLVSAVR
jgi:SAM-dependent methyltransferase